MGSSPFLGGKRHLPGSYLPLTGGTLTGALTGTDLTLTGALVGTTGAFTGAQTVTLDGLAALETNGLSLINSTAATSGAPVQRSPGELWTGHAWDTDTAQDDQHDWQAQNVPINGNTTTSKWVVRHRVKRGAAAMGAWVDKLTIDNDGIMTIPVQVACAGTGTAFSASAGVIRSQLVAAGAIDATGGGIRAAPTYGFDAQTAGVLPVGATTATGLQLGKSGGTIGLYATTPVAQQTTVADATDAASVILRFNECNARLKLLGVYAAA